MGDFLAQDQAAIAGLLIERQVRAFAGAEAEQILAWAREVELLASALRELGSRCTSWSVLLEVSLLRLGKRIDAVILAPGVVIPIEFKIGATSYLGADRVQAERYGQCLRDFHEYSQTRVIAPILCADLAGPGRTDTTVIDGVAELTETNGAALADAIATAVSLSTHTNEAASWEMFEASAYRPTPTVIEAARALYAGHGIADIGRGDAADAELQATAACLLSIVSEARDRREKVICFVTGTPGAGKTLLGLDLALRSRAHNHPAALLSGNRPLVHVLTEALAQDQVARTGGTLAAARHRAQTSIQNLMGYLKEHTDGPAPPENVIVFDEAQRAWDAQVGQELMGRLVSEPELFLNILDQLDWAVLVCLVGPGQEINRGEGGLPLWGEAIGAFASRGRHWRVVAAPQAITGGPDTVGPGLAEGLGVATTACAPEPRLHLANSMRAYRNILHGRWVAALLRGDLDAAADLATQMSAPPAILTRDLSVAKDWLRQHRRGGRTVGLLAASSAIRLVADGIPPSPRSNELDTIGHWFLKPHHDYRSAGALETPMSEYGCQGLELDYIGLCWGGDLIWGDNDWIPRKMSAPRWQLVNEPERKRFRLNAYRVLLTRARAGSIIYVPLGSDDDPTRSRNDLDRTAKAIQRAGCGIVPI